MFGAQLAALRRTYAKGEVMSVPVWEVIEERQTKRRCHSEVAENSKWFWGRKEGILGCRNKAHGGSLRTIQGTQRPKVAYTPWIFSWCYVCEEALQALECEAPDASTRPTSQEQRDCERVN